MSKQAVAAGGSGIGFGGLLGIVFITLKLCSVIDWPWPWVLAPLWAPFVLIAAVIGVILGAAVALDFAAYVHGRMTRSAAR